MNNLFVLIEWIELNTMVEMLLTELILNIAYPSNWIVTNYVLSNKI